LWPAIPQRQAHQLFALKRMKGRRFGRQEYRFICPNTVPQSTTVSSNGRFFCSIIFMGNYSGDSGIKVC
jgi:hypothetical protein